MKTSLNRELMWRSVERAKSKEQRAKDKEVKGNTLNSYRLALSVSEANKYEY
jgi:hypothetical protein